MEQAYFAMSNGQRLTMPHSVREVVGRDFEKNNRGMANRKSRCDVNYKLYDKINEFLAESEKTSIEIRKKFHKTTNQFGGIKTAKAIYYPHIYEEDNIWGRNDVEYSA